MFVFRVINCSEIISVGRKMRVLRVLVDQGVNLSRGWGLRE